MAMSTVTETDEAVLTHDQRVPNRRRPPGSAGRRKKLIIIPLILVGAVLMLPIAGLLLISFTEGGDASVFSRSFSFDQFAIALNSFDYLHYAWNSIKLGFIYTVPAVFSSLCAGYAFARLKAPGSNAIFAVLVATMLVPLFVYIIPLFVVYSRLGLTNTEIPWLLWGLAGNAFYVFLFRQFFDAFPHELEEAAMLDGLSRWGILTRIVLPNSYTAIATVAILAFTNVWGEVLLQGVLLYEDSAATLSVRLSLGVLDEGGASVLIEPTLAALVLYILPPVVVFIIFQRFILQGVATTGIK